MTQTWLDRLSHNRIEEQLEDSKPLYREEEAQIEASRCLCCFEAPCITACPTSINVPQFISRIATGNLRGAARTILKANALGLSCAQACPTEVLCEGACVHHKLSGKPVAIGQLQRFAVEHAYREKVRFFTAAPSTGKRVVLLGAGPASLSCARELRLMGHETVIFEKSNLPGGLNTFGIAPYKMKIDTSLRESAEIASLGVQFEFGSELGKNLNLNALLQQFDAVFLGLGLGPEKQISFPGSDSPQVQFAESFISKVKSSPASELAYIQNCKTAVVIGGGNTAIDAARLLKRLHVPRVVISYRRTEDEMPGFLHERLAARSEGIEFYFQTLPVRFENRSLTLQKTRRSNKGDSLELNEEKEALQTDLVLLALNHESQATLLSEIPELNFKNGKLEVNPQTGATRHPRLFAGGDLTSGGKEVVHAVADGKNAARAIHEVLIHG